MSLLRINIPADRRPQQVAAIFSPDTPLQRLSVVCRWLWRIAAAGSIIFTGCFLLFFLALIFGASSLYRQAQPVIIPNGSALVLAPHGSILEKT
ncbi:hypothetical protein VU05_00680, partial [Desulfobulbus sp. F1]|nr:hypothetical protein [Desulfobulbus sp. F1]